VQLIGGRVTVSPPETPLVTVRSGTHLARDHVPHQAVFALSEVWGNMAE
jgi:hypothetical protein